MLLFNFVIVPYRLSGIVVNKIPEHRQIDFILHFTQKYLNCSIEDFLSQVSSEDCGASIIVSPKFSLIPHFPPSSPVKHR